MKTICFLLLLPFLCGAQTSHKITPSSVKTEGYQITGEIKGYPDGTAVSFLNQQTGTTEKKGTIVKGKFSISGKVAQPGFVVIMFNDAPPMVPIFLDNSNVHIKGDKDAPDNFSITGSESNTQYVMLAQAFQPYNKIFSGEDYDTTSVNNIAAITESFVKKFPASYVSPFAIVRYYQATENGVKAEQLFNSLGADVKRSDISQYLSQLIAESRKNPIGSILPDFSQPDVDGKVVKLSSFKGKYLLVDFWASWCRPCRMENPAVVAAFNEYKNKNFYILGVSLDKAKPAWQDAIKMDNLNWAQVSDLKGWSNDVAQQFQIQSIPQNFLLDPQGRIIAKNLRGVALEKRLHALLN